METSRLSMRPAKATVTLRIENLYEFHPMVVTTVTVTIPMPPNSEDEAALRDWEYEHIHAHVGTGRTDGDSFYYVEIIDSTVDELIGRKFEFGF